MYLVFLTTNLFDTLDADKKIATCLYMCLEPSELYILHKLNKMAVSTPKIPWVPMFLFF